MYNQGKRNFSSGQSDWFEHDDRRAVRGRTGGRGGSFSRGRGASRGGGGQPFVPPGFVMVPACYTCGKPGHAARDCYAGGGRGRISVRGSNRGGFVPRGRGGGGRGGGRGRGRGGFRGGRGRGRGRGRGQTEDKNPASAEDLDREMDDYFMKKEDIAARKLDGDLDDYWNKKDDEKTGSTSKKQTNSSPVNTPQQERAAEDDIQEEPTKIGRTDLTLNIGNAIDKAHEGLLLQEIIKLPPSALQGLPDRANAFLKRFKIHTIESMANWKFYKIASAVAVLAEQEDKDSRPEGSKMNINNAMDKAFEKKSLNEIADAPPSALQGLADWVDEKFDSFDVKTIKALGTWKYFKWAQAITNLSGFELEDKSSKK